MLRAPTCNTMELLGGGQVIKTTFERRPTSLGALAKVLRRIRMPVFYAEMEATLSQGGKVTKRLVLSSLRKLQASFPPGMFGRVHGIR